MIVAFENATEGGPTIQVQTSNNLPFCLWKLPFNGRQMPLFLLYSHSYCESALLTFRHELPET